MHAWFERRGMTLTERGETVMALGAALLLLGGGYLGIIAMVGIAG